MLDRAEQRILDETARQLRSEDPNLANRLAGRSVGEGIFRGALVSLGVLALTLVFLGSVGQALVLVAVGAAWWAHRRRLVERVVPRPRGETGDGDGS